MYLTRLLKSLLPRGSFWEIEQDSVMDLMIKAFSQEFERIQTQTNFLNQYELDPDYQNEIATRLGVPVKLIPILLTQKGPMTLERWYAVLSSSGYLHAQIQDDSKESSAFSPTSGQVSFILPGLETECLTAGSEAGSYLETWGSYEFEELINKFKPVLVIPNFIYPIS